MKKFFLFFYKKYKIIFIFELGLWFNRKFGWGGTRAKW